MMKVNRKKKKILSLFLAVCMAFSVMPANLVPVKAAVSDKYQIGGVFLDMDGTTEGNDGAWKWDGASKTVTILKSVELNSASGPDKKMEAPYTMVTMGLPAGTTIVLKDGVKAQVTSYYADAIYCEGDLTITGNGALNAYGSNNGDAAAEQDSTKKADGNQPGTTGNTTGYEGDDTATGSAIVCHGKLTIGSSDTTPFVYAFSRGYTDHTLEINADGLTGESNPVGEILSGHVEITSFIPQEAKIYAGGSDRYLAVKGDSALQYPAKNMDNVTLSAGKVSEPDSYYYGTDADYYYVMYNINAGKGGNGLPATKIQVKTKNGNPADLTVTAGPQTGYVFCGWNTTAEAADVLESYTVNGAEVTLYAIYKKKEETPAATVNYAASQLTGLTANASYVITFAGSDEIKTAEADSEGKITIDDLFDYYGKEISVVKAATDTTASSDAQTITLASPSASLTAASFTVTQATNGEKKAKITEYGKTSFSADYEYSTDNGNTWVSGTGEAVLIDAESAGSTVLVRKAATDKAPASEAVELTINKAQTKETTPAATVNYASSQLENLIEGEKYLVTVGDGAAQTKTAETGGKITVDGLTEGGKTVTVVKAGNGTTSYNSDAQTIVLDTPVSAPTENTFTVDEAEGTGTTATISGITNEYEYSTDGGKNWTPGDGSDVTVNAGESILIRKPATENTAASETLEITTRGQQTQEQAPGASVDYTSSKLTNLTAGEKYLVKIGSGEAVEMTADADGKLELENLSSYGGQELLIVKKGNGTTTYDSKAQTITLEKKAASPSKDGFTVINGETQSVVKNITSEYEYSTDNGASWTKGNGTDVTVPAGTEILIRKIATEDEPESEAVKVETKAMTPEAAPAVSVDYTAGKLTGLVPNAEYAIAVDGKTITFKADASGKTDLSSYYGKTIAIVKKGNGTTTCDSAAQTLKVAAQVKAPSENKFPVSQDESGKVVIKNVTSDMEYSLNNGAKWITGTGADVVVSAGTTVLIRKKGSTTTPPSDPVVINTASKVSAAKVEQNIINANTDKGDVSGSGFSKLCLKATGKSTSIKLSWKKLKGVNGYILYGSQCGSKMKRIKTFKGASKTSYTAKKLKKGKYYKYMVVAYKNVNGKKVVVASSKSVHAIATKGTKKGNPTAVKLSASKVSVKVGKTKTIRASFTKQKGRTVQIHIAKLRYESSNKKVVTVNSKGKIKGKKKGTAYIYVYAQNGVYKRVKVTVK